MRFKLYTLLCDDWDSGYSWGASSAWSPTISFPTSTFDIPVYSYTPVIVPDPVQFYDPGSHNDFLNAFGLTNYDAKPTGLDIPSAGSGLVDNGHGIMIDGQSIEGQFATMNSLVQTQIQLAEVIGQGGYAPEANTGELTPEIPTNSTDLNLVGGIESVLAGGFDEQQYLDANPDVARAVQLGIISSGLSHFQDYGYSEGRPAYSPQDTPTVQIGHEDATTPAYGKVLNSITLSDPLNLGAANNPILDLFRQVGQNERVQINFTSGGSLSSTDNNDGFISANTLNGCMDDAFTVLVQSTCSFIEDKDIYIPKEQTSKKNTLLLSTG